MELKRLAEEALDYIKSRWVLPGQGLLAGGSLANTIWALKNGTEPLINDVDVFVYVGHLDFIDPNDRETLFRYTEKEVEYYDDYNGYREHPYDKKFYAIKESTRDGMVNTITYDASDRDPMMILESFDLSCTGVGYDLETGQYFWTQDFEDFINTGKIKVSNIGTPSHTAIRLAKKSKDLGVDMDEFELKLLMHAIDYNFSDTVKRYFKQKRMDDYTDVEDILSEYLVPYRVEEVEKMIFLKYDTEEKIYGLKNKVSSVEKPKSQVILDEADIDFFADIELEDSTVFGDNNIFRIMTGKSFLNYMRNVYGDEEKMKLFNGLVPLFGAKNYFDEIPKEEDSRMLALLCSISPLITKALKDMTISEQINVVKTTFAAFDDKTVALAALENGRVVEPWMDESDVLLMELSLRKEIFGRIESRIDSFYELLGHDIV
jgi:hypothetical protein